MNKLYTKVRAGFKCVWNSMGYFCEMFVIEVGVMERFGLFCIVILCYAQAVTSQCPTGQSLTFSRWSGAYPESAAPVFVYAASGNEASLTGACLARCRELEECAAVVVSYGRGNCHGVAAARDVLMKVNSDVGYFQKKCLEAPQDCTSKWWSLEVTPGYHLNTEGRSLKVLINTTMQECYAAVLSPYDDQLYRSAQWVDQDSSFDAQLFSSSDTAIGNCILNLEDKFTEPESYRVANYQTFYIENQCRHDYSKKIDRCSYEEYYNQTLKHVEYSITNITKDECRSSCELEDRFICRGFTWGQAQGRGSNDRGRGSNDPGRGSGGPGRGLCDLHSEDLVSTGSWLLRRSTLSIYYRRVICLNISVDCEESSLVVTYRPRGTFRGAVYVPGRGERCSARGAAGRAVTLRLPMYGDCDVNFAHAIHNTPTGQVNRTMAYVMVMIQSNPIIQTAGDRWVRVGCSPGTPQHTLEAAVAVRDTHKPSSSPSAPLPASAVFPAPAPALSLYVLRAEPSASTAAGPVAVALGEPLDLRLETSDESEIEAYHLVASSRLGDSSVLLIDSRGCPTGQVDFPGFTRSWHGRTQRLSARFKAFRFPSSHVVRFALMVRYCNGPCQPPNCLSNAGRATRETNDTYPPDDVTAPSSEDDWPRDSVVAQGGASSCGGDNMGQVPMEVEVVVGSKDIMSADTLVRADHRSSEDEEVSRYTDAAVVCVHELLLVALALAWLAVQILLLVGCCVLVKRYRNLAELSLQKDYHSFDNVGFDTLSTHRRVHWPDQHIDILHST